MRLGDVVLGETVSFPLADEMVMVYVPAGEFEMGSGDDEAGYALQMCSITTATARGSGFRTRARSTPWRWIASG
jgi:formylglycine-generating enzyme required for sulfatase activity